MTVNICAAGKYIFEMLNISWDICESKQNINH